MPKQYEKIRDKCAGKAQKGSKRYKECQAKAAAIYNARHPKSPVGRKTK